MRSAVELGAGCLEKNRRLVEEATKNEVRRPYHVQLYRAASFMAGHMKKCHPEPQWVRARVHYVQPWFWARPNSEKTLKAFVWKISLLGP